MLTYRGNPSSGGQGVYVKHLSKALTDLGHSVEVLSGPPYPHLDPKIRLHRLPSLDLYNADHLFKVKSLRDLAHPLNMYEFISMCTGAFPEPYTFGVRAHNYLQRHRVKYDIVHDNQCLAYGIGMIAESGIPTVATIHHPITVDRQEELNAARSLYRKIKIRHWYSFIRMQKKVARKLSHIITVSECSRRDIAEEFFINESKFRVVYNGVNMEYFYPVPNPRRPDNSLIVTNSADTPLKGLRYLLQAVAEVRKKRPLTLTVIGEPKKDSIIRQLVGSLGIDDIVHFTGRIRNEDFARYYSESTIAVVPSLYEGFGIPAAEAMACGVPLISTSGGALPEVVGDAGIVVPPADSRALAKAINCLLDDAGERSRLARAGLERVNSVFSWEKAARDVVNVYREAIDGYR
ncbi:MAG: glycosyltransferase family 1 protein [Deltaproteobacteria bacterium HGW-Deltaproteobacteria-12]|jgi:glycosyltransferase involved in cell wall biosynthesis|nr:MAG: glycosyltransferase family 1 protein [Deltaproteobacteria bacterium HGW-Deltaproteobacteria-12]